jgi:hypothetical protein
LSFVGPFSLCTITLSFGSCFAQAMISRSHATECKVKLHQQQQQQQLKNNNDADAARGSGGAASGGTGNAMSEADRKAACALVR